MELTQEHFDRQLENLQGSINTNVSGQMQAQTDELKNYIHRSFETQQNYIDERFSELFDAMKVKEEVAQLRKDIVQIKSALHLS